MITRSPPAWQSSRQASDKAAWQAELAGAITDPAELLRLLDLPDTALPLAQGTGRRFPLRVPRGYVARMRKGDPHDPLLLQVWPLSREDEITPGFGADPVGDLAAMRDAGVLHKYHGRVLLVAAGACGIHCRYCFRRHFPYAEANPARDDWRPALDYLARDASVTEVILSGGDPLLLSDRRLEGLARRLAAIAHLQRIRVHTRLPVVIPERVDDALLAWLAGTRLRPVMVVHINHANEIDTAVRAAMKRLSDAGVALLNQSVLLRGINDSAQALARLSEALFDAGVMPYYLHLLDRVQGAAHFEVAQTEAREIMMQIQRLLPGYLVPRLVREEAGAPSKRPIALDHASLAGGA
jgi:EF-P beta-lysylation protein EpmB